MALLAGLVSLAAPGITRAYDWPVVPFDRQHRIRGNFDDPRTRTGRVDRDPTNSQSFHDGVDIQVPDGTPVYSIAAGEAFIVNRSAVAVVSPWGSAAPPLVFGYWHVDPAVADHQQVALHGLLGYVRSGAGHVHLSELRFGRYVNPLRVGGLSPYVDRTAPVIRKIALRPCEPFRAISVDAVSGCVDLVVNAFDPPPLRLHGPWSGAVLPPFRVTWGGLFSGFWLPAAVRPSIEFDHLFDVPLGDVYAWGTRQNLRHRPATYYFWLARDLDTRTLADGEHTIHVSVSDVRGNRATRAFRFTVANSAAEEPP
ncbi:MAG TPA: M23 family metallopeptidase [Gaiellaceae bacterium]|nr:M23 family metallopeptidase [Gaiellaceae bacterium]